MAAEIQKQTFNQTILEGGGAELLNQRIDEIVALAVKPEAGVELTPLQAEILI